MLLELETSTLPATVMTEPSTTSVEAPLFSVRFPPISALDLPPTLRIPFSSDRFTFPSTFKIASEFQTAILPPLVAVILPFTTVSDAEYAPNFAFLSIVTLPSMVVEANFSNSSLEWKVE